MPSHLLIILLIILIVNSCNVHVFHKILFINKSYLFWITTTFLMRLKLLINGAFTNHVGETLKHNRYGTSVPANSTA